MNHRINILLKISVSIYLFAFNMTNFRFLFSRNHYLSLILREAWLVVRKQFIRASFCMFFLNLVRFCLDLPWGISDYHAHTNCKRNCIFSFVTFCFIWCIEDKLFLAPWSLFYFFIFLFRLEFSMLKSNDFALSIAEEICVFRIQLWIMKQIFRFSKIIFFEFRGEK